SESETPGAVDLRAERGVHDELHAAALVEEALQDDALLRRHAAERLPPRLHVLGDLLGGPFRQRLTAFETESGNGGAKRGGVGLPFDDAIVVHPGRGGGVTVSFDDASAV